MRTILICFALFVFFSGVACATDTLPKNHVSYCGTFRGISTQDTNLFMSLRTNEIDPYPILDPVKGKHKFTISTIITDKTRNLTYTKTIDETYPRYIQKKDDERNLLLITFRGNKNREYAIRLNLQSSDKDFWKIVSNKFAIEEDYDPASMPIAGLLRGGKVPEIKRKEILLVPCKEQ